MPKGFTALQIDVELKHQAWKIDQLQTSEKCPAADRSGMLCSELCGIDLTDQSGYNQQRQRSVYMARTQSSLLQPGLRLHWNLWARLKTVQNQHSCPKLLSHPGYCFQTL